jgi:osmoprotectant transport system permease protein
VHSLTGDDRPLDEASLARALEGAGLRISPHLGFENTYALAVTGVGATGDVRTISDLKRAAALKIGLSHEFLGRRDGWLGLCEAYAICGLTPTGLDHGLAYDALVKGSIDVTDAYATDAKIERSKLRVLVDDAHFFPNYDALFVERATLSPAAVAALSKLSGAIDPATMRGLNAAVELDGRTPTEAAERFVAGRDARGGGAAQKRSFLRGLIAVIVDEGPQHLLLVFASLLAALAIGVPLGVVAHEHRRLGRWVLAISGVVQTIPSLALFSFLIPVFGIGAKPALVALSIYALLPIVRNTYVGLTEVPAAQREAAIIMDLSRWTRISKIELPLASRTILAGIKTSAIIGVGTATIAAFIGAGGFGVAISAGLSLNDPRMILQGALPAAGLALLLDGLFALGDRVLVPRGLRLASAQARDHRAE